MIEKKIGFAGDLMVPTSKYMKLTGGASLPEVCCLVTIADLFLIHDKISFRIDHTTIRELYNTFTMDELDELINNDRISFYKPVYSKHYKENWNDTIENYLNTLPDILFKENIKPKRAIKQIFDSLENQSSYNEDFTQLKIDMHKLFYEKGIQRDSFFNMDVQIGFNQAIEKIRELWSCGLFSTVFDEEILYYLDICDKAAFLQERNLPISEFKNSNHNLIGKLHLFKNLPTISELIVKSESPTKKFIDIVNSSEAYDLRKWIQSVDGGKDIDVRELYDSTLSKLPSKKKWVDWTRFGGVTVVSGILGSILTANPALGLAIGGAVCAIDKKVGSKLIDSTSKEYTPDAWFRFINNKHL